MVHDVLREAGLSKGESKVYLALVEIGESTVGPIARKADVSLSKIYEILDNLIRKGLVSSVTKNNVKYFLPADPERIIDYLKNKKDKINEAEEKVRHILPDIKSRAQRSERAGVLTLFEGFRGIKTFYEQLLRRLARNDCIYAMGIPRYSAERYEGYFLDWNKRRARKGIKINILFDYDVRDLGKKREKISI